MLRRALMFAAALLVACGGAGSDRPAASAADSPTSEEAVPVQGGLGLVGTPRPEDAKAAVELANAVASSKMSLVQGFALAAKQGHPIGGEFQLEQGKLELTVYTMKGDDFFEVSIDPQRGAILGASRVRGEASRDLPKPSKAMAAAKTSLAKIVSRVAAKNARLHALSAFLVANEGHPTVTINLVDGAESKFVTEDVD